jgi:predicted TIM-barrel fold metal-dependent hydrolase
MFRDYPNLYADLSAGSAYTALTRDVEFTRDFLIEFQDRILYGRDYFDNRMQELLNALELPNDVLTKIYAGNALRLVPDEEIG